VNPHLQKYGDILVPDSESNRVFVPLCGKSVDMAYLASTERVSRVVGIDIIKQAAEEFAQDHPTLALTEFQLANNNVDSEQSCDAETTTGTSVFHGNGISIMVDDLFNVLHMPNEERAKYMTQGSTFSPDENDSISSYAFDSIYDRASMVAIDPSLRKEYSTQMGQLLKHNGVMLLVTLDRRKVSNDTAKREGPPFSISESEVRQLYESQEWVESVELLEEVNDLRTDEDKERWAKKGVLELFELVFVIRKKSH
jgi:thiopurine S-methyltransferase